ncbi:MAG TPA: hypothetical protein VIG47_02610 [Gemmatimonadaceae bacterium]
MYSTCLFCHNDLGANEVVEHFPIGRRLAFDGDKGRLWVICRSCERWNLTPMEERWEAIEECERLFRGTTLRMSTDHIGLARVSEGLELVRIGNPQRPEMAAWRYGDQFGKRRRRYYTVVGVSFFAVGALVSGYAALGLFAGGGSVLVNVSSTLFNTVRKRRVVARVPTPDGLVDVTAANLPHARIIGKSASDWSLSLAYRTRASSRGVYRWYEYEPRAFASKKRTVELAPNEALPALAALLPSVNGSGGTRKSVQGAVQLVEQAGDAMKLLNTAASLATKTSWNATTQGRLSTIPLEARLALEMMTHEDAERRALEGELAVLEERWKEAEEIAGISDNMFLPASVTDWMQKLRG